MVQIRVATFNGEPGILTEFLRRTYLDLTGRLPTVGDVRKFLADTDLHRRSHVIDTLFPADSVSGMRVANETPSLDRWTFFFSNMFRIGGLLGSDGSNVFYDYRLSTS